MLKSRIICLNKLCCFRGCFLLVTSWLKKKKVYSCHVAEIYLPALGLRCSHSTSDIWGQMCLYCGVCPVYWVVLSSLPGLYPGDASSSFPYPLSVTNKDVSRHCQGSPRGQSHLRLRTIGLSGTSPPSAATPRPPRGLPWAP